MQFSNKSLSVGNRIIDSEHQKLGDIINDIGQLMLVNHDVALSVAIKTLTDALSHYFVVEENVAKAVNFDFAEHSLAHQKIFDEFQVITHKLMEQYRKQSRIDRKLFIDAMNNCLVRHVQEDSKPFTVVMGKYLYDFAPGMEARERTRQEKTEMNIFKSM